MLDRLTHILQHNCLLDRQNKLVLGVSGGPDSICLLDILHRSGFQPVVAHLNHGLRPSADAEEKRLACSVERLGLVFVSKSVDVLSLARANGMSVEEGARHARYSFLFEQAERLEAQAVLVGHNANDQVETVLMHLLRGAGLAGLTGMQYRSLPNAWSGKIPLARPLLGTWREEILVYLAERGLPYETDETNTDISYYRNRLRHDLIPYLRGYNPEILQVILRMANLLGGEYEVVEQAVEVAREDCQFFEGNGYVSMTTLDWMRQMPAIQRSLLRKAIGRLQPGLRDLDYDVVEKAMNFLYTHTAGRLDLIAGITLLLEPERFFVLMVSAELPRENWPQMREGMVFQLPIPGECRFQNGWVLYSDEMEQTAEINNELLENNDPFRAWLDFDKLTVPLTVRSRRAGDRMQILGMQGRSAKLSDLMINAKLPERVRGLWPVVLSGEAIVWVPGIRAGDTYKVDVETRRVVCLQLARHQE